MYRPGMRGLGAAECNWQDEFGNCITPGSGDTVVTPGGLRVKIGGVPTAAPASQSFSTWLNENGKWVAIAAATVVALSVLKR